jgi:hypothetical protein
MKIVTFVQRSLPYAPVLPVKCRRARSGFNPGSPTTKAGIIPLDHWANFFQLFDHTNRVTDPENRKGNPKECLTNWMHIIGLTSAVVGRHLN